VHDELSSPDGVALVTPLHLAAALLMVTIWGGALRARPFGGYREIPFHVPTEVLL
jgi:hypothetical protein